MTDTTGTQIGEAAAARISRRYRAEKRFKAYGLCAVLAACGFLVFMLGTMIYSAMPAFTQHTVKLDIVFETGKFTKNGKLTEESLGDVNFQGIARNALRKLFPDVTNRRDRRKLGKILSAGAGDQIRRYIENNPDRLGKSAAIDVLLSDDADLFFKGLAARNEKEENRRLSNKEIAWLTKLENSGRVESGFSVNFFTSGDSREPELAGILSAIMGSVLTLSITLLLSFPIGVAAATYLEEFAPKNRWTEIIEVNINNLAAVPSIVFGLLGLAVFLGVFGLPRSAPLVGGMVLALLTLPTIIIATRAAIRAVPPSIREAALGIGASDLQVVVHHVLPLAGPGILTGSIIGMAGALGETAPLLMIGMVAFIVDVPASFTDPSTVLPVQIFIWADSPERAFLAKTSAATLVLLGFLVLMNGVAVFLRKRFERRW